MIMMEIPHSPGGEELDQNYGGSVIFSEYTVYILSVNVMVTLWCQKLRKLSRGIKINGNEVNDLSYVP